MLWSIMAKKGVPAKLIDLIKCLYDGSTLNLDIDGVESKIDSTTGVKQGDNLASILFLMVVQASVQAAIETMEWNDCVHCAYTLVSSCMLTMQAFYSTAGWTCKLVWMLW
jgi:hypothetical protein